MQTTKLEILSKKDGSFQSSDGSTVSYYWYRALRISDGMTIEFGSRDGSHDKGDEIELYIEKFERPGNRIGYKEISE